MHLKQFATIEYILDYIEKHLEHPLSLNILSKEVGISKYYLLHLFKTFTSKNLMSYVRNRRLNKSLQDLLYTDIKILDIAMKYHFSYEQSYIRAFRNHFHITPAKLRRLKLEIAPEPRIDLLSSPSVPPFQVPLRQQ